MSIRILLLGLVCFSSVAAGLEIPLEPIPHEELGDWARVTLPFRLHPTTPAGADYDGPPLESELWGELSLGEANHYLLLGFQEDRGVDLWLSDDGQMEDGEEPSGEYDAEHEYVRWDVELTAEPPGGEPYPYELGIIWPEGRGYVFLEGGMPRRGKLELDGEQYTVVLLDGDLSGVFGTEHDFYAVDWTQDDVLHAEPGGHEHFLMDEPVTIEDRSFLVEEVAPDGEWMRFAPTEYEPPKTPLVPGYEAPDFTFDPFPDGPELSLSDLQGKVVLLDFWATWCVPCMDELPRLRQIHRTFGQEDFEIIGVSLDTNEETLRQVLEEYGVGWPQYFDGGGWKTEVAELYRIEATPHLILLDQEGVIHAVNPSMEELPSLIEKLLGLATGTDSEEETAEPDSDPVPDTEPVPDYEPEEDETPEPRALWPLLVALGVGVAVLAAVIISGSL
ncbi:MAG: TlpA disulfide reductase family protein [Candidatus Bipolaricaulota bacterium]